MAPLDERQLAEAQARVARAEQLKSEADSLIENARADCLQAQREFERAEKLVETGDVSRQDFERARNSVQMLRQQLEAARFRSAAAASEVEVARAALISVERAGQSGNTAAVLVRAPVTGRVLQIPEASERVVTAGMPIIEMSNATLEIVIDVLSTDAVKVKPGASVLIGGWGGEHALKARVRMIEPSAFTKVSALGIEEQRVNVIADFIDDPGALLDGYRVEAQLIIWEADGTLLVPSGALFRKGESWSVFVVEKGLACERRVEIGHRTASDVEILSGLDQGTKVILYPNNHITDGVRVYIN
jgi:HlyD family secretion protein